ncbi:MAG: hypothetical protein KDA87_10470 [Planctomycetales bacterium]|nr:hypothetical protein [Planctomycetales bacterium]
MIRLQAFCWFQLLLLTGCQGGYLPYVGQAPVRIPPPATGAANANDPYYRPNGTASLSNSNRTPAYTARQQARFTSEEKTNDPAYRGADVRSSERQPTFRNDLPWRSPDINGVVPASATESGQPRPRFGQGANLLPNQLPVAASGRYTTSNAVPTQSTNLHTSTMHYLAPVPEGSLQAYQRVASDARFSGWQAQRDLH